MKSLRGQQAVFWLILLTVCAGLALIMLVLLVCAFLFHLANAAMLTLGAQKVSTQAGTASAPWLSGDVIVTQLVTIPLSLSLQIFDGSGAGIFGIMLT